MKKIISLLLTLIMVFSLATVAAADENVAGKEEKTLTYVDTVDLAKVYKLSGQTATNDGNVSYAKSPAETFKFTIEKVSAEETGLNAAGEEITLENMPMFTPVNNDGKCEVSISFAEDEATLNGDTNSETLTLPTYDAVGVYTYKITELPSDTAGLSIDSNVLYLKVTVVEDNGKKYVAALHYADAVTGSKEESITNTYAAGALDVTKTVTGNLGDKKQPFHFTATFNAPENKVVKSTITYTVAGETQDAPTFTNGVCTVEFNLAHGETASFKNLPEGVTYTVTEAAFDNYTTTKTGDTGTIADGVTSTAAFTNNKSADVDTGISLDSAPYFLMLAVAVFGMVALVSKKRYEF